MNQEIFGLAMMRQLYHYQQEGHLCDVTLISSSGRGFVAHAAVIAAASSVLRQLLEMCERGMYTVTTSISTREMKVFIHYAYTGYMEKPVLAGLAEMGLLNDENNKLARIRAIISLLDVFESRGLFGNITYHGVQPAARLSYSYTLAAQCPLISNSVINNSSVLLMMSHSAVNVRPSVQRRLLHAEPHVPVFKNSVNLLKYNQNALKFQICYKCKARFLNREELKKHLEICGHQSYTCMCAKCDTMFTSVELLKKHTCTID